MNVSRFKFWTKGNSYFEINEIELDFSFCLFVGGFATGGTFRGCDVVFRAFFTPEISSRQNYAITKQQPC